MFKVWLFGFAAFVFLSGCGGRVRTYTIDKPRVDTEISGNQGYLMGTPPEGHAAERRLGPTRKVTILELDLGPEAKEAERVSTRAPVKREYDKDLSDLTPKPRQERAAPKEIMTEKDLITPLETARRQPRYYIIKENDTLQKISLDFYGTTRRWEHIFKANEGVMESPDKIFPGMRLEIPYID